MKPEGANEVYLKWYFFLITMVKDGVEYSRPLGCKYNLLIKRKRKEKKKIDT
jgi:hypothetical protein